MKKVFFILTAILLINAGNIFSQRVAGFYQIAGEEGELKINVNVTGFINYPGRYEVPLSTNIMQLVGYAGGPREYAVMDDVKVYRTMEDGSKKLLYIDLEDLNTSNMEAYKLKNEDLIVIEKSSFLGWRDFFSFIAAPVTIIASIFYMVDRIQRN